MWMITTLPTKVIATTPQIKVRIITPQAKVMIITPLDKGDAYNSLDEDEDEDYNPPDRGKNSILLDKVDNYNPLG